jgi:hypothetical protein
MYVRATFGKFSHSLSTQLRCKPMDKRPVGINNFFELYFNENFSQKCGFFLLKLEKKTPTG